MIIHSGLARHVCVLLGYLYPALASAKAAVQQDPAAFTQWMTYWVVISVFALAEILVDFLVSWVPFYFEAKIVLIVWLTLPKYQGASQIYRKLLHPYLEQYEGDIDSGLEGMRVEATRRIQSLGVTAASEIAKAVTRQGSSAKEQLFTRVLGMVSAGSSDVLDEKYAARSAPPSPREFQDEGGAREQRREEEDQEETAAADAGMLLDFVGVMKEGVFVQARALFAGDGDESWVFRRIRIVNGRQFSMGLDSGAGEEDVFEVLGAEADTASDQSLLLLRTDRGQVDLSLQGKNDRDAMLIGFELLLSSTAVAGSQAGLGEEQNLGTSVGRGIATRGKSRRWDTSGGGSGSGGGMLLESADEASDGEGYKPPPASMSQLQKSWVKVE